MILLNFVSRKLWTLTPIWEQEGPRSMLLVIVKKFSLNDSAYLRVPFNADGRPLHPLQQKSMQKIHTVNTEPSFVVSIFKMWKLRWLIVRSKSEMLANKVLKKFKHQSGDFIIFSRFSS